jgi:hypothetical protein
MLLSTECYDILLSVRYCTDDTACARVYIYMCVCVCVYVCMYVCMYMCE